MVALVESESQQARCALCGGNIAGKTIVKHVDGQRLEFDKGDCETIFDRLTAVYGTSFGLSLRDS